MARPEPRWNQPRIPRARLIAFSSCPVSWVSRAGKSSGRCNAGGLCGLKKQLCDALGWGLHVECGAGAGVESVLHSLQFRGAVDR